MFLELYDVLLSVICEERIIMVDLTGKRVIVVGTGISGIGSVEL